MLQRPEKAPVAGRVGHPGPGRKQCYSAASVSPPGSPVRGEANLPTCRGSRHTVGMSLIKINTVWDVCYFRFFDPPGIRKPTSIHLSMKRLIGGIWVTQIIKTSVRKGNRTSGRLDPELFSGVRPWSPGVGGCHSPLPLLFVLGPFRAPTCGRGPPCGLTGSQRLRTHVFPILPPERKRLSFKL